MTSNDFGCFSRTIASLYVMIALPSNSAPGNDPLAQLPRADGPRVPGRAAADDEDVVVVGHGSRFLPYRSIEAGSSSRPLSVRTNSAAAAPSTARWSAVRVMAITVPTTSA